MLSHRTTVTDYPAMPETGIPITHIAIAMSLSWTEKSIFTELIMFEMQSIGLAPTPHGIPIKKINHASPCVTARCVICHSE